MAAVAFYISGHGFGHASRQIEIINALGRRAPHISILIRSAAPRWLFDLTVSVPTILIDRPCDTGVVQIDSLRLDAEATIGRAAEFYRSLDARAAEEAGLMREHGISFVVSDAPPLACAAAAQAGIRSVVAANFTWDWIYEVYEASLASAPELLPAIRRAYALADSAWRLPMHGGFSMIRRIVDVPFVARHATHRPAETRRRLGLPAGRRLALSSFGGYGVDGLDLRSLDCLDSWDVIVVGGDAPPGLPPGVRFVDEDNLYSQGLRYEDLVRAVDVVVTKPGYGIISECIANDTAMLYTPRGYFAEYARLVREMPRYLRCGFIDNARLLNGVWNEALEAVAAQPAAPETPPTNGAEIVAEMILRMVQRSAI